jgi:ribosome-binding ATPase
VALDVGIVGLPKSGKTTLFNALTGAGADPAEYGKPHVGMAAIVDERLEQVATVMGSPKVTQAALRVVDLPGTEASVLGSLRQVDAILAVTKGFGPDADPARDLATLELDLLVADRDHVERRIERVRTQAKSGDPALKAEIQALEAVLAHLDAERPLRDYADPLPPELEPLTTKAVIHVENGPVGVDAKLELELRELSEEEASQFREGPAALPEIVGRLFAALDLVTFFTANENEARGWTLRRGRTALEAAGSVHTDMAHGFVRCEVIRWNDLVEAGSHAEVARRGLARLEGKDYVVEDGDVLTIRFTPPR